MDRNQLFSMALATATLGLTACGGGNDVVLASDGTRITPATVACTAPEITDISYPPGPGQTVNLASVCVPSGGTSSRYDLQGYSSNSGAQVYKMDFTNASCTGIGTRGAYVFARWEFATGTTTVASLGADGVTPVTGSGRTVTVSQLYSQTGTFAAATPLVTTGTFTLCKTTPASTTTMRVLPSFANSGSAGLQLTATYVIRGSAAGSSAINTAFGFEGGTTNYYE